MESKVNNKVVLNISDRLLNQIAQLIDRASNSYLRGQLSKSFFCLKALKLKTQQSFSPEERKNLKTYEYLFLKNHNKDMTACSKAYEDYYEKLMDLLNKYDYLVRKATNSSRIL